MNKSKWQGIKNQIFLILKSFWKFLIKCLVIVATLLFAIVPFLHNLLELKYAQCIWYPALLISFLFAVIDVIKNRKPTFKTPVFEFLGKWGFFSVFPLFASIFVLTYYNIDYIWLWVIFGIAFIYFPVLFIGLLSIELKQKHSNEEKKQKAVRNVIKYIILYWLYDLFYMSVFNKWLVLTCIFGTVAAVIVFYNLTKVFLTGEETTRFLLPFDLVFGVGLSVYVIYIIPNETLQTIVLTITAAVFGGILTLVGVAWTIKDNQRQHFESKRLEKIPYLQVEIGKWIPRKERKNDFADMYLIITKSQPNEGCSSLATSFKITNIGLGLATDISCQWVTNEVVQDVSLPISLLKCDSLQEVSVMGMAKLPEEEVYHSKGLLLFEFKDLLGNKYQQEFNIFFEIHDNFTKIISCDMGAPMNVNE